MGSMAFFVRGFLSDSTCYLLQASSILTFLLYLSLVFIGFPSTSRDSSVSVLRRFENVAYLDRISPRAFPISPPTGDPRWWTNPTIRARCHKAYPSSDGMCKTSSKQGSKAGAEVISVSEVRG